jgi:MraZ protein
VGNLYLCNRKIIETKMSYPVGHFNCNLDSKGRVSFPSEFKEQFGDQVNEGFVLHPDPYVKCLELYTVQDWRDLLARLSAKLSQFKRKQEAVMRRYDSGSRLVKLDSNGRLLIPKDLIEKGSLEKEIVITSVMTKMEIWDRKLYEQSLDNEISDEEYFDILESL